MTVRTIYGTYASGYSLSPAYSGLVIASSARVYGQGVYVSFTASVANYGQISTSGRDAHGVYLKNGGAVTNGSTAATGATITGYYDGVAVKGAAASIANFGTISGASPNGGGVYLGAGGSVTNGAAADTLATIRGGYASLIVAGGSGTVTNFGIIQGGTVSAVELKAGGSVTNGAAGDTGATISGSQGVDISGGVATIANFGTISSSVSSGVALSAGGTVTNGSATDTAATIEAAEMAGVFVISGSATVNNFGTITRSDANSIGIQLGGAGRVTNGSTADRVARIVGGVSDEYASATIANYGTILGGPGGVVLGAGGSVTNGSAADPAATISGYHAGVYVKGAGATVTNFGAIVGTGGPAVDFVSAGDTLVAEAGCGFTGAVLGGGGTLDLDTGTGTLAGAGSGTVTVSGSMAQTVFQDFDTLLIGATAQFRQKTAVTIAANQVIGDVGLLSLGGKGGNSIVNRGTLQVGGSGTLTLAGAVTGAGQVQIAGGLFDCASSFSQAVSFTGKTGTLELAQSQGYAATISGFSKKGKTFLDFDDIAFSKATTASYAGTKKKGVLTVTDGTHTATIHIEGNYLGSTFVAAADGHGGTIVHDTAKAPAASPHPLIAAMAGMGAAGAGAALPWAAPWPAHQPPSLTAPRTFLA